jgi:hypothetical protein
MPGRARQLQAQIAARGKTVDTLQPLADNPRDPAFPTICGAIH